MAHDKLPFALTVPQDETDRHVSMSNRLARATHSLNLAEKRLVALGLAGTDSADSRHLQVGVNAGWKMKVNALEYAEAFGLHPTTAYEQMRDAANKLFERQVNFQALDRKGKSIEKKLRWVSSATYLDGDGAVELNFSPEIAPHLLGLRKHFTSYKLRHAAAFDTVYAWRLFEVLKSWQSTGLFTTSIEDFWELMEAPPSCQKDFRNLRVRIIEPAVESIKTKANMLVKWEPTRAGSRRVTGLEFRFAPNPQGSLLAEQEALLPTEPYARGVRGEGGELFRHEPMEVD
jgi:plasmid replication initiation protein